MNKKTYTMLAVLLISLIVVGCNSNVDLKAAEAKISILEQEKEELQEQVDNLVQSNTPLNLIDLSLSVMDSLKNNDMNALSTYVHPSKGLRFTPYPYVDIQNDKLFTAGQVAGLSGDTTVYSWGNYDGSGDPIDLSFADYYNEFIYDRDFLNPHLLGNNTVIGTGNIIDNRSTAYPNGSYIEYHFTGFDTQYAGMDWASLTLVFEQDNGDWYLVGIIHGQWTI